MDARTKAIATNMLMEAYYRLGVKSVPALEERVRIALDYLSRDREHFIEAGHKDTPVFNITERNGVVCKLVPLAQEIMKKPQEDHVRQFVCILSLMVSNTKIQYVYSYSHAKLYPTPGQNSYSHPFYKYTQPEEFRDTLQLKFPEEIRPVATQRDRDIFRILFVAFERLCGHLPLNAIPHKTEQAMIAVTYALPQKLKVDGKEITGKLIPLASSDTDHKEFEDRHRSIFEELNLLITDAEIRYLIKTQIHDQHFIKVHVDTSDEGWICEPTSDENTVTYRFVELADIEPDMHPLYY